MVVRVFTLHLAVQREQFLKQEHLPQEKQVEQVYLVCVVMHSIDIVSVSHSTWISVPLVPQPNISWFARSGLAVRFELNVTRSEKTNHVLHATKNEIMIVFISTSFLLAHIKI